MTKPERLRKLGYEVGQALVDCYTASNPDMTKCALDKLDKVLEKVTAERKKSADFLQRVIDFAEQNRRDGIA